MKNNGENTFGNRSYKISSQGTEAVALGVRCVVTQVHMLQVVTRIRVLQVVTRIRVLQVVTRIRVL